MIPIVVRNDTSETVSNVHVKTEAHAPDGSLLGVGETVAGLGLKPTVLFPGDIAIGFVMLQGDIPSDAEFSHTVTTRDSALDFQTDLVFGEVTWLGDRVVGELTNPGPETVEHMYLTLMCFGPDGTPRSASPSGLQEVLPAGQSTSFQIGEYVSGIEECSQFLVAGYGNHMD